VRRAAPLVFAGVVLAVIALGILAAIDGRDRGGAPRREVFREKVEGPSLVLQGVDFREIRPDGATVRLQSERASYAILDHGLSARGVTVVLPGTRGEIVLNAPLAAWDMDAGIVRLPEGGRAEGAGGWSATVPDARLDLPARRMTATDAILSGPGLELEGRDLVWSWKDGTMTMDAARGRVLPGKVVRRHA